MWTGRILASAAVVALVLWYGRPQPPMPPVGAGVPAVTQADPVPPAISAPAANAKPVLPPGIATLEFLRGRDGTAEAVQSGSLVRVGDELWMRMATRDAAYVYVFNEDDAGEVFALFPVNGTEQRNPLRAGARYELPGARAGESLHWQVSSPGGRERFLVIASRTPLVAVERAVAALTPASADAPLAYAEVSDTLFASLRGVGRMRPATPTRETRSRLDALVADLALADGVWLRRFELVHEGR